MKVISSIVLLLLSTMLIGQASQQQVTIAGAPQNAFVQDHQGATTKHVEEAWKSVMKPYGKTKDNRKTDAIESLGAKVPMISRSALDVYMVITKGEGMARSAVFFDNGTAFISSESNADETQGVESFLSDFADAVQRLVVEDELKDEEKNLDGLDKDLGKLIKENEKLHEAIADYERKILEAEDNITTNLKDQDDKNFEIETQKTLIEQVKEKLNNIGKK